MRFLVLAVPFLGLSLALTATAAEPGPGEVELTTAERIVLTERAVSGDLSALDALRNGEPINRWTQLMRGYALSAIDRDEEAVEAWTQALAEGQKLAVRALATHHFEQREWLEAYAWARLAMEVDAALSDLDMDDMPGRWTLYAAVQAAERLDDVQHAAADGLAADRVERFLPVLIRPSDVAGAGVTDVEDLDVVERTRPTYPRAMAENQIPGWAYLQFEVRADGRVGEIAAIGASHDRFARAAVRGIRKWRFNTSALEDLPMTATQFIDFELGR